MHINHKNADRILACVMAMVIVFVISFFLQFGGVCGNHSCKGESCPICQEIHSAERIAKHVLTTVISVIGAFYLAVFAKNNCETVLGSFSERNLITDKIRIND